MSERTQMNNDIFCFVFLFVVFVSYSAPNFMPWRSLCQILFFWLILNKNILYGKLSSNYFIFFSINSFALCGLALPLVPAITCPTKN